MEAELSISIGEGDTVLYHIRQTRAPREYDGFGTIELVTWSASEGRYDERLVMIRDEHLEWQEARYSSGLFACTVPEYFDIEAIKTQLWKRISTREEKPHWMKRQPTKRFLEEKEKNN